MFKKILLEIHAAVAVGWVEAHKFVTANPKIKSPKPNKNI
jgi:hypothetical protein